MLLNYKESSYYTNTVVSLNKKPSIFDGAYVRLVLPVFRESDRYC